MGERHDGDWCVRVSDNFIGIESAYSDQIFNMFKRLHSRTKYEGTGIDLSVCKKIAEQHGGKISVESSLGHEITFVVTVPATESVLELVQ